SYQGPVSVIDTLAIISKLKLDYETIVLEEKLSSDVDEVLELILRAQQAYYRKDIDTALKFVNQSIELYGTAQGYALRGSLYYLKGNKSGAQQDWDTAIRYNPDIFIPDMATLDQIIRTD